MLGGGHRSDGRIDLLGGFAVTVGDAKVGGPWRLRSEVAVKLLALAWSPLASRCSHRPSLAQRRRRLGRQQSPPGCTRRGCSAARASHCRTSSSCSADGDVVVDADVFAGGHERLQSRLGRGADGGTGLWTGDLLPEDLYEDWAKAHRDRFTALHVTVAVRCPPHWLKRRRGGRRRAARVAGCRATARRGSAPGASWHLSKLAAEPMPSRRMNVFAMPSKTS
jgi:hypothetical protein